MNINYDATTEHGIRYVSRIYNADMRYQDIVIDLDSMSESHSALMSGDGMTTGYTVPGRSRTIGQVSPDQFMKRWDSLLREKRMIESRWKPRKAVSVVMRDW